MRRCLCWFHVSGGPRVCRVGYRRDLSIFPYSLMQWLDTRTCTLAVHNSPPSSKWLEMLAISSQTEGRHQYELRLCFLDFPNEIGQIFEEIWWFSNLCTIFQASKAILCPQPSPTASHRLLLVVLPFPGHTFAAPEVPATRVTWKCQVGKVSRCFRHDQWNSLKSVAKSRSQADFAHRDYWLFVVWSCLIKTSH